MGGRSSTSATTEQTDNRRVIGEGGVSAENSTVNQTSYTYQENLGGEVVDSALTFAGYTADGAFNFAGDALYQSLGTVDRTVDTAFAFGGDALSGALQFGALAMQNQADLANASIGASASYATQAGKTADYALGIAQDSFGDALKYSAGATSKVFDAFDSTTNLVKDAYADAKGRGALTDKILIGALIAMGVVAFAAVKK